MSDLFGYPLRPADAFPPDGKLHGFDTVAEGLNTSTVLLERYLAAPSFTHPHSKLADAMKTATRISHSKDDTRRP